MSRDLNPAQLEAVHTLRGPLLVLAGAGSGKTRVVTYRMAELIRHGTKPERILAVTFTKKAAREMAERVAERLGKKYAEKPQVSTFHSHCVKVLRRNITRLGYPAKFAIYDRGDQEGVARNVLREIRVPGELLRPGDLLFFIGNWKTHGVRPEDAATQASNDKEHLAAMAYRRYQKAVKTAGAVDFDDLLLATEELLTKFEDVRRAEAGLFDHLLIDEYQDTNGTQYRIVKALAREHRNLCVVGDDDQSIYGWRGAEVEHILRFAHDWPDAKVVRLEDNYRCTAAILELANRLIGFNRVRHEKVLKAARAGGERPQIWQANTETEEAQQVVADIRNRLTEPGREPRDFAILFRTNEQPRTFEAELRKWKVPYVLVGGMSFYDRREVKDIISYLRVVDTPANEVALLRIINTPPRGIGQSTVEKLMTHAVSQGINLWDVLCDVRSVPGAAASAEAVDRFVKLMSGFRERLATPPNKLTELARSLIDDVKYHAELERIYPEPSERESRLAAVEEVVNALAQFEREHAGKKNGSLGEFLDELTLGDFETESEKDKQLRANAIALMTLHSAKGLEFPHVYLVGLEEGILPHHRSLGNNEAGVDEERRLCYVGITRAQDRLTLSTARTRMKWGKPRDTHASRFLFEMTGQAQKAPGPPRPHPAKPKPPAPHAPPQATVAKGTAKTQSPPARRKP